MIWLSKAKNVHLAEIHSQIDEVYREGAMNNGSVRKWCQLFKEGSTNVHSEEQRRGTNSSSGTFLSILHTAPTLHQMIISLFYSHPCTNITILNKYRQTHSYYKIWVHLSVFIWYSDYHLFVHLKVQKWLNVDINLLKWRFF